MAVSLLSDSLRVCSGMADLFKKSYPQFVLLGDSLIQNSGKLLDGFSFQSSIYSSKRPVVLSVDALYPGRLLKFTQLWREGSTL